MLAHAGFFDAASVPRQRAATGCDQRPRFTAHSVALPTWADNMNVTRPLVIFAGTRWPSTYAATGDPRPGGTATAIVSGPDCCTLT